MEENSQRGRTPFESDELHIHQSQQIQSLQACILRVESVASEQEKKLKHYKEEIEHLKQDVRGYKLDDRRHMRELKDKDSHISILNTKVAQLLTISHSVQSPSLAQRVEKDLPSPAPRNWRLAEPFDQELKLQRPSTMNSSFSLSSSLETLDVVDDDGLFPIYHIDQ